MAFALIAIDLLDGDIAKIGLVYFFRLIPFLFVAPIGGALADGASKKTVMILAEAYRAAILIALFALAVQGAMTVYVLVGLSMLLTVGDSLFQPSFRAVIVEQVSRDDIPAANSAIQVVEDTASIIGPLMCAAIVSVASREIVLAVVGGFFVCSLLSLTMLPRSPRQDAMAFSLLESFRQIGASAVSLRERNRELFVVILGTTVSATFASAVLRYVFPAAIVATYANESYVGYASALIALGTVCGGLVYTRVVKHPTSSLLMRAWIAYGTIFVAVALLLDVNLYLAAATLLVLGFAGAIVDITINTTIQLLSEEREVGRNFGLYAAVANTGDAVSGLVAGGFALLFGGYALTAMSASIALAAAGVLTRLPR
ncbi:MAG: MFS transporter [Rhodobacteraceae bacterium]|nr:MFS transporter [Paracoccaceae bacterium]